MNEETKEALRRIYNYTENRHHDYCWNAETCKTCEALEILEKEFPDIKEDN